MNSTPQTNILLSTKDNKNLTFKRITTISHNDGKDIPPLYYDNETDAILQKNYDYKLLFRFFVIILVFFSFFIIIETISIYSLLKSDIK